LRTFAQLGRIEARKGLLSFEPDNQFVSGGQVKSNWAILGTLAECPGGRARLDDLEASAPDVDPPEIASALDGIDIVRSGLVVLEGEELQITEAGRSALRALEVPTEPSSDPPLPPPSGSLGMIDDLIGAGDRQKIFGLELRRNETDLEPEAVAVEDATPPPAPPVGTAEAEPDHRAERVVPVRLRKTNDADRHNREAIAIAPKPIRVRTAPVVSVRDEISSGIGAHESAPSPRPSAFAARIQQAVGIWRRHLERDAPDPIDRRRTGIGGWVAALLTLLVLVIFAGAVISITQIRSLQSELATLQRELSPLRERLARAEFLEKARQAADQQKEAQNKAGAQANKGGLPPRVEQVALSLTPEEIRLIRDFIKPAPTAAGPAAPPINVGDTVSIATIPLPSSLMEKIPKLLGARFTTRNGSIIILRRDSRQADFVLPAN